MLGEAGEKIGHGKSVDLWSLGIALHLMLTGDAPFWDDDVFTLVHCITNDEIDIRRYSDLISEEAISLLTGLLTRNVKERLGCGKQVRRVVE